MSVVEEFSPQLFGMHWPDWFARPTRLEFMDSMDRLGEVVELPCS